MRPSSLLTQTGSAPISSALFSHRTREPSRLPCGHCTSSFFFIVFLYDRAPAFGTDAALIKSFAAALLTPPPKSFLSGSRDLPKNGEVDAPSAAHPFRRDDGRFLLPSGLRTDRGVRPETAPPGEKPSASAGEPCGRPRAGRKRGLPPGTPCRSPAPRPLPPAPDRLRPGGFGARCGEKEAAAELQRGQQQRVPSGADSVIRPPGIPFSDIPGTDRTGNGHGPAV